MVLYCIINIQRNYNIKRIDKLILAEIVSRMADSGLQRTVRNLSFLMVQTRTITQTV